MEKKTIEEMIQEYNYWVLRNIKAEEFFVKNPDESINYIELFNEIVRNMSRLSVQIEKELGRELTFKEKFYGFK